MSTTLHLSLCLYPLYCYFAAPPIHGVYFPILFLICFIDYAITVVPPPFIPLCPAHPLPPTFPPFSSCPWVIYISSSASTVPILNPLSVFCLPFMLLILCTFSSSLPFLLPLALIKPSVWSPFLWFCSCSSSLLSFCFCFLDSIVDSYEFVVLLLFIVLIFFFLDNSL